MKRSNGGPVKRWDRLSVSWLTATLEAARVIMRRLMWNLNDESEESGGDRRGHRRNPCCSQWLAHEYVQHPAVLCERDGNYIEHRGIAARPSVGNRRLAEKRPELVRRAAELLLPYLKSQDG